MQKKKVYYSARAVIQLDLIPWIKSIPTLTKWIKQQMKKDPSGSVLDVIVKGKGTGSRYFIAADSLKNIQGVAGQTKGIVRVK